MTIAGDKDLQINYSLFSLKWIVCSLQMYENVHPNLALVVSGSHTLKWNAEKVY